MTNIPLKLNPQENDFMPETQVIADHLSYQSKLITTIEELSSIRDDWETLYQTSKNAFVFCSPDWQFNWINTFSPDKLFIIALYDDKQALIAVVPLIINKSQSGLFKRQLNILRFVGDEPCLYDQMDFLIDSNANIQKVAQGIASVIHQYRSDWEALELNYFANQTLGSAIQAALKNLQLKTRLSKQNVHIISHLSHNIETYFSVHTRAKKHFKKCYHSFKNKLDEKKRFCVFKFFENATYRSLLPIFNMLFN